MATALLSNGSGAASSSTTGSIPTPTAPSGISADEIALYDRQIRLWGLEAQERLRKADVLLIGMRGLGNEIAKNLALAGIKSLTMVDDTPITDADLASQFLAAAGNTGTHRSQACLPGAQALNPRVKVEVATLAPLLANPTLISLYTIIIATDQTLSMLTQINILCRTQQKPFYACGTFGLYGFIFADLIQHTFNITREKSNISTQLGPESPTRSILSSTVAPRNSEGKNLETVIKRETYCPINLANTSPLPTFNLSNARRRLAVTPILSCIRALWDFQSRSSSQGPTHSIQDIALFIDLAKIKHAELQLPSETLRSDVVKSFLANLGHEISPVCAFLGGQVSQDVINVLGGREQPIQNFVVLDGEDLKGVMYCLWTDVEERLREVAGEMATATATAGVSGVGAGATTATAAD